MLVNGTVGIDLLISTYVVHENQLILMKRISIINRIKVEIYLFVLDPRARESNPIHIYVFVFPNRLLGVSVDHGAEDAIRRLVCVPFQGALGILVNQASAVATIERRFIQNSRIFNIESGVAHHGHHTVNINGQFDNCAAG